MTARAVMAAVTALAACMLPVTAAHGEKTTTVDIVIENGRVVGKKSVRVSRGDTVVLRWSSDRRLKLHLHGYDVETTVSPAVPAEMKIRAHATGRFPVAIHRERGSGGGHSHSTIFHLEVYPD